MLMLLVLPSLASATPDSKKMKTFIDQLMAKMTIEEKAGQLTQYSANMSITGSSFDKDFRKKIAQGKVGSLLNATGVPALRELQRLAVEETRLKIPLIFGLDVVWGYKTMFPIPLAESCSWDLPLIEKSARVAAIEAAADGIDWTFAPMVDIGRDPRWGRVAEGAGEDPWWGSRVAAARVRGFQGKDLSATDSVVSCVKHFAAYGAAQGGRDYNTVDMSKHELFETYLPPYKGAVDAGVATAMSSFNEIAGIPSTGNPWLLNDLLRKQWGFKGLVVTDYSASHEMVNHGFVANNKDAAMVSINAGADMDMENHSYYEFLPSLVREGKVKMSTVDTAVRRVLELKYRRGLFEDPYRYMDEKRSAAALLAPANLEHAREMARRSMVLLKNVNKTLPLKEKSTVALIGPLIETTKLVDYKPKKDVTFLEGLNNVAGKRIKIVSAKGTSFDSKNLKATELLNEAVSVARRADVVVLALGEVEEWSGEAASRAHIGLPKNQQNLLKAVFETGKPIVLVLSSGRPLALEDDAPMAQAILQTWFLGSEAGNALADVLMGDVNPSGKLTMTFPRNEGQIPIFYAHKNTGRPFVAEDKYTTKYLDSANEPLYPFGWGLSYTNFEISPPKLSATKLKMGGQLKINVTVTNNGDRDGHEVVQLYLRDLVASVTRPVKQLRGYKKVFLKKGETADVEWVLTMDDFKFYDKDLKWIAEPGDFKIMVGSNSVETKDASFTLVK